jgi:hypothetical protein
MLGHLVPVTDRYAVTRPNIAEFEMNGSESSDHFDVLLISGSR